jgi:osmotically-inducible protein OsmY
MIRTVIRLALVVVVVVAAAAFFFGYWTSGSLRSAPATEAPHTARSVDVSTARERGAEVGEQVARTTAAVSESMEEGALTAKIKAKMVLDDLVKARTINVTTKGSTVTLKGYVYSQAERERAVQLAKETNGVTRVVDQLDIRQP